MSRKSETDKAGFPMIWVDSISAHVHWLPVTKIQFEIFLCDSPSKDFSDSWYQEILGLNGRISPRNVTKKDYWKLFITGIKPEEAQAYADWCSTDGNEYSIPTLDEWNRVYQSLKQQAKMEPSFPDIQLSPRAELLVTKLDGVIQNIYKTIGGGCSLADQMLMRYGVMEWIQHESHGEEWAGMGQTDAGLRSMIRSVDTGTPETPRNVAENRFHYYGFRLIRR